MSAIVQLTNHKIFENQKGVLKQSINLEAKEGFVEKLSEYGVQTLNRTQGVLRILGKNINGTDPLLLRKNLLDQIDAEMINLKNTLTEGHFLHDQHLNTINQRLDNLLSFASQIVVIVDDSSILTIRKTVSSLRKSVGIQKSHLARETKKLEEQSNILVNKTKEVEDLINEYSNQIETEVNNIKEKTSEIQENFISMQEKRSEAFLELKEKFTNDFNNYFEENRENELSFTESYKNRYEDFVKELENIQESFSSSTKEQQRLYDYDLQQHKSSVEELVGIISTSAISAHFKEIADYKRKIVNRWQIGTVAGFIVTIIFGIYTFVFQQSQLDTYSLIARSIVTLALGSFTGYAARQVTKNEAEEKYNRGMEVELKTLSPYIASLNPEDQENLKKAYFSKIFTREITREKEHEEVESPISTDVNSN